MSVIGASLARGVARVEQGVHSLLSLVIAIGVAYAFGALDVVSNALLASYLGEVLGAACRIQELSVCLFPGTAESKAFRMAEYANFPSTADALSIGAASVSFCPRSAFWRRLLVVKEAALRDVRVVVSRHSSGAVNYSLADKRKRASFYDEFPKTRGAGRAAAPVVRVAEPESPRCTSPGDDDFVMVDGGAPSRASSPEAVEAEPDFFDRAGDSPGLHGAAEPTPLEEAGSRLWGLLRTKVAEKVEAVVEDATTYERTLRTQRRRSSIEDMALQAIDAGRTLNVVANEIYEDQSARALALAKKTARESLQAALDRALEDDDDDDDAAAAEARGPPPFRLAFAGPVTVSGLTLALVSADGTQLLDPPLAFERCAIPADALADDDAEAQAKAEPPAKVLKRALKLVLQQCLDDLVEHRPDEARRLASAIGEEAKKEATKLTVAHMEKHFPKTAKQLLAKKPPQGKTASPPPPRRKLPESTAL